MKQAVKIGTEIGKFQQMAERSPNIRLAVARNLMRWEELESWNALEAMNLTGSIPPVLAQLSELRELKLW